MNQRLRPALPGETDEPGDQRLHARRQRRPNCGGKVRIAHALGSGEQRDEFRSSELGEEPVGARIGVADRVGGPSAGYGQRGQAKQSSSIEATPQWRSRQAIVLASHSLYALS